MARLGGLALANPFPIRHGDEKLLLMLADFPVLHVDLIVKRTIASCALLAIVAAGLCLLWGQALAGAGVVLGLAGAVVNHRLFQSTTAHFSDGEGHLERKPYFGSVALRLGGLTVIAFVLCDLVRPMGFGMIAGLVAFQLVLMANAFGALWRYQRTQLAPPPGARAQAVPVVGALDD